MLPRHHRARDRSPANDRDLVEIWFATDGERIYLLSGGGNRAHWVRNLRANPRVRVRLGGRTLTAKARVIDGDEREASARRLLAAKYQGWREGMQLSSWASGSLPVEIVPEAEDGDGSGDRGALVARENAPLDP